MDIIGDSRFKVPKAQFKETKFKGDYNRYSEDTIRSFHETDAFKSIGIKKSESEFILRSLGFLIMEEFGKTNQGFKLPLNLGTLSIVGLKSTSVNKFLSAKYNKKIYNKNINTGGLVFRANFEFDFSFNFRGLRTFTSSFGVKQAVKHFIKINYMIYSIHSKFSVKKKFIPTKKLDKITKERIKLSEINMID